MQVPPRWTDHAARRTALPRLPTDATVAGFPALRLSPAFAGPISRPVLFAALLAAGFVNGIATQTHASVESQGFAMAVFNTFDVSVVVWLAGWVCLHLLLQADARESLRPADIFVAIAAAAAFLMPVVSLSWLALSGLAAYLGLWGRPCLHLGKAAAVMLAMTIPMFWSRLLFTAFSGPILAADALLVSWIVGTQSVGNTVELADGSGWVFIAPACSSLTNVSIAILCAVVFVTMSCRGWTMRSLLVATLACGATVLINVLRIGTVGLYPDLFPLVHGATGNMLASWFTLATIFGICMIGIRPDAPRPR